MLKTRDDISRALNWTLRTHGYRMAAYMLNARVGWILTDDGYFFWFAVYTRLKPDGIRYGEPSPRATRRDWPKIWSKWE